MRNRNFDLWVGYLVIATISISSFIFFSIKIESTVLRQSKKHSTAYEVSRDIETHILSNSHLLLNYIVTQTSESLDNLRKLNQYHDAQISIAFGKLYEDENVDASDVNQVKNAYLKWQSKRNNVINSLLKFDPIDFKSRFFYENDTLISEINSKLDTISNASEANLYDSKQKHQEASFNNLKTEVIIIVMSIFLLLSLFYSRQRYLSKEKKAALSSLNWSNQILDSSPDAMIISDRNGDIKQVNLKAELLFGYSKKEFQHLNISQLMPSKYINHQEKISSFFNNSKVRGMDEMGGGKILYARSKHHKEFPVEISLNLAELDERKVAITIVRDVTEKKQIEAMLIQSANFDSLTDLPNRKLIHDRLQQSINQADRYNKKFGVLFIDLDDFKKVNDHFSHEFGDSLLKYVANMLNNLLRTEDTIGRLSGDEFLIIAQFADSKKALEKVASKILSAFANINLVAGEKLNVSCSIGISLYPEHGQNCEELIRNADLAMYESKGIGKNTFAIFNNKMLKSASEAFELENRLRNAVEKEEFYLVFQPIYEMEETKIVGFEALLRWHTNDHENVGPEQFIPILEKIGLINKVSGFILRKALETIKYWRQMTSSELYVAINISPLQLSRSGLFASIQELLTELQLSGSVLEIELTEKTLIEESSVLTGELNKICGLGVGIALDDFGTGYSSLQYLTRYPISSLKIDKSFVDGLNVNDSSKTKQVLIDTTLYLARALNLSVTAEGIEFSEQLSYLKDKNCNYVQGYYLSKPLPLSEINQLLGI